MVVALAMLCGFLAWRLMARQAAQQPSVVLRTDRDIQLLRQDLRAQKQQLIAQNLPMTESEAIKFWAIYNRYARSMMRNIVWSGTMESNGPR